MAEYDDDDDMAYARTSACSMYMLRVAMVRQGKARHHIRND